MSCPCDRFDFPHPRFIAAGLAGDALGQARTMGGFPLWRRALLEMIGRDPRLAGWRAREAGDLGLMLIEMAAAMCDVVAFYDALLGGEAYLRSARFSGAQRRLVELLGFRPRPAIGGEVLLNLQAEGVRVVTVPAGAAFRSIGFDHLAAGIVTPEKPQVYELETAAQIDPRVNRLDVDRVPLTYLPASLATLPARSGTVRVQPGQTVVLDLAGTLVTAVVASVAADRLTSGITQIGFAAAVPIPAATTWAATRVLAPGNTTGLWKLGSSSGETAVISGSTVLLDGRQPIAAGTIVLFEYGAASAARRVTATKDELRVLLPARTSTIGSGTTATSLVSPPVQIVVTRLTLDAALPWSGSVEGQMVVRYALTPAAVPAAPFKDVLEQGDPIRLPGLTAASRTPVGLLAFDDAHGNGLVVVGTLDAALQSATAAPSPAWGMALAAPVQLSGNVLKVTRGESVRNELIGIGDGAATLQTFRLAKKPLTYLQAASGDGRRSTLQVRVGGVLWREVPSFHGQAETGQVYIVRHDEAGETFISFGGAARLPTGVAVTADYRFGAGAAQPGPGMLTQLVKPLPGVRSLYNSVAATGGADAQTRASLATDAPRTALLLERAVSLPDIEALAAQTGAIVAAQVRWRWAAGGLRPAAVVSYITSAAAGATASVEQALSARLRDALEEEAPIAFERCLPQAATLTLALLADPRYVAADVAAAVKQRLLTDATPDSPGGLLTPASLGPEGSLFFSHLVAAAMAVEGVVDIAAVVMDGTAFGEVARLPQPGRYFDFSPAAVVVTGAAGTLPLSGER